MDARHLMTPALKCLDESDTVVLAARRMRALGVSSVPVCGAGDQFVGMVFERDIVEHCVADAMDPRKTQVGAIVQIPQQRAHADQPADSTVLRMVLRQPLGLLPVVEHGALVGVITLSEIAGRMIDDTDLDRTMSLLWSPPDPQTG